MPIIGSQGVVVTMNTLVAGQLCQNVLLYNNYSLTDRVPPSTIAAAITSDIVPYWLDVLSEDATLMTVLVEVNDSGSGIPAPPIVIVVNTVGVNASEALPPFVACRLQKIPNNALIEPADSEPVFRQGWVRIAGCPESFQDNGLLTGTGTSVLADLTDAILSFTAGISTFAMQMNRAPSVANPDGLTVPVADIVVWPVLGSQNSRKIVL